MTSSSPSHIHSFFVRLNKSDQFKEKFLQRRGAFLAGLQCPLVVDSWSWKSTGIPAGILPLATTAVTITFYCCTGKQVNSIKFSESGDDRLRTAKKQERRPHQHQQLLT
jgi:hypothetical protein